MKKEDCLTVAKRTKANENVPFQFIITEFLSLRIDCKYDLFLFVVLKCFLQLNVYSYALKISI